MNRTVREAAEAFREAVNSTKLEDLSFPTSIDAGRRVLKAVENPDIGMDSLSKIVVAEPLLSAKVIRLANSVALNPANQPVRDIKRAVLRVGMDPIKSLAMVLIVEQLRQSQRHPFCRDLANRLWERSVHVAALSYVLARRITELNPDEAMFAGIVNDLGRFYLLSRAADFPELLEDRDMLVEMVVNLSDRASSIVFEALNLPPQVLEAVLASRQFSGAMPPQVLSDLLYVAGIVSPRRDPFFDSDEQDAVDGQELIALGIDPETITEAIAASGEEIYSIVLALET